MAYLLHNGLASYYCTLGESQSESEYDTCVVNIYDRCAVIDPKGDDLTMTRLQWAEPVDVA
jgi:hypothetical protein